MILNLGGVRRAASAGLIGKCTSPSDCRRSCPSVPRPPKMSISDLWDETIPRPRSLLGQMLLQAGWSQE